MVLQLAVLCLVVAGNAGHLVERAFDGEIDHALDEAQVIAVGGGRAGEIAGFLHHRALGVEEGGELFLEPVADIDRVDLHMAESVALDAFAGGFALGDDGIEAGAFRDEERDMAGACP